MQKLNPLIDEATNPSHTSTANASVFTSSCILSTSISWRNSESDETDPLKIRLVAFVLFGVCPHHLTYSIENVTDTSASTSTCPGISEAPVSALSISITAICFILFDAYATA